MIRLSSTKLSFFIRLSHNKTIFHVCQVRKPPNHILVASFTQSSTVSNSFFKSTPFGSEKVKEEEEQLNDDNSEHVVIDEFKSILKDDDDYTKSPKKITDPNEIKENIFVILQKYIESSKGDLMQFELKDSKLKFEVLRDCTMIIGKKIPNFELNKINTVKDAIDFFTQEEESDQRKGHPVAEWFIKHKDELPSNMMFIPYVKERGVNREDRSKRQKFKIKEQN
ncbi:hypothetical protein RhiirA5_500760 [Rhizophagus irregularis]|uniref:Large ribosomal subunit protein mL50 n=1 Tax=Rhizophagus irregularis TaxID=588596 RepID=A0A2N0PKI2_9GLOM|nr:hypothetical protein RhiirA5_500760 [Rhizophagus irregularis]